MNARVSRLVLPSWFYLSDTGSPGSLGHSPGDRKTVVVVVVVVVVGRPKLKSYVS